MVISDDTAQGSIAVDGDRVFAYGWTSLDPSFGFADHRNGCPRWLAWGGTVVRFARCTMGL